MYSKSFNSTIQYNGRRRQLLTAAQESAKEALEWAVNNGAPDHVLQTYRDALPTSELASQGAFSSGYAAARRQLGGSGVGVDLSCYGSECTFPRAPPCAQGVWGGEGGGGEAGGEARAFRRFVSIG